MQIMPPSYSSTNLYWIQIDVCTDNIDGTHTHTRRASASTYGRHWCFHALFLCRSQWNTKFCYRNLLLIRSLDQYSYSTHKTHQTITIIIPIQWISYNSGEFSVLIKSLLGVTVDGATKYDCNPNPISAGLMKCNYIDTIFAYHKRKCRAQSRMHKIQKTAPKTDYYCWFIYCCSFVRCSSNRLHCVRKISAKINVQRVYTQPEPHNRNKTYEEYSLMLSQRNPATDCQSPVIGTPSTISVLAACCSVPSTCGAARVYVSVWAVARVDDGVCS